MTGRLPSVELVLLRHAEAERKAATDMERPLTKKGRDDAAALGRRLASPDLRPDGVFASPAARARQTAELAVAGLGDPSPPVRMEAGLYDAAQQDIAKVLGAHAGAARRVLVVAHNPGLSDLAAWLCNLPPGWSLSKCAAAHIRVRSTWQDMSRGCGRLIDVVEEF
ncbi:MAG: histidine phosphatase family protein [Thermoplasmatota archaeon]